MNSPPEYLTCSRCARALPVGQFYRRAARSRGFSPECKSCHKAVPRYKDVERRRDQTLRRRYGIGAADYDALLAAQSGRCALCNGASNGRGRLAVDHDHETGRVRGLLCFTCNTALGRLETVGLERAVRYADRGYVA